MKWKLYFGLVALTNDGRDCVKTGNADNKKRAAYLQAALLLVTNGL